MNKLIYSLIFLICSGLLATALILHYQPLTYDSQDPSSDQTDGHTKPAIIREAMSGVTAWQYNEQGEKIQSLKMASWKQFVKDTTVYMKQPALQITNEDGSIWTLNSRSGQGLQAPSQTQSTFKLGQFDTIKLLEQVQVSQKQADTIMLHLDTEELTYLPNKQWVSSDTLVTVTKEGMRLQANSLFAELDKKIIQFSGQVDSLYENYDANYEPSKF